MFFANPPLVVLGRTSSIQRRLLACKLVNHRCGDFSFKPVSIGCGGPACLLQVVLLLAYSINPIWFNVDPNRLSLTVATSVLRVGGRSSYRGLQ